MITFIDDDGKQEVWTKLRPLFVSKNIPCVLAISTGLIGQEGYLNMEQLQDLYQSGWEIASHTKNHVNLSQLSRKDQEYELHESKKDLVSWGLGGNSLVYPYGEYNLDTIKLARKYYDSAFRATRRGESRLPLHQYILNRDALGTWTRKGQDTLGFYKKRVDISKKKGRWVIFAIHIADTSEIQLDYISQLLEYCIEQKVDVVTIEEALIRKRNQWYEKLDCKKKTYMLNVFCFMHISALKIFRGIKKIGIFIMRRRS